MSIHKRIFALTGATLLLLNACSTTGPSSEDSRQSTQQTQTRDEIGPASQTSVPGRSLADIARLTINLHSYEPDKVLEIIRTLESLPSNRLRSLIAEQQLEPEFTEWLELALQIRTAMINGEASSVAAQRWADYHYGQAVGRSDFSDLLRRYTALFPVPSQVAILLPEEGSLTVAARAIRDGILSAYLEQPGDSVIRFYSSGQNDAAAIKAYRQAQDDGAMQIIGPLRIESTRAIAGLENLDIPVLLLNNPHTDTQNPPASANIVASLALSQTEEAATIAEKALTQGFEQAIVITPNSTWGNRMAAVFTESFSRNHGRVTGSAQFDPTENDHSAMLTQLLKIDESRKRKDSLQARLGLPLAFEPHRRNDFDMIFLAATPTQGRELKPLLRFHNTGDIPVYAMGRIFSGKLERTADQDLNGIVFPITSWQLQTAGNTSLLPGSVRDGSLGSLYALGMDAWRVLPWLPLLQKDPDLVFPGSAGALRLLSDGHLHREPAWAQFTAGRPLPYQWNKRP